MGKTTNGTSSTTEKTPSEPLVSYVKAIEDPPPEQYCVLCLRKAKLLCSICKWRRYCSEECQRMDKGHKPCEKAPSKEEVEEDILYFANQPKYNSRPMDASPHIPTPQFPEGTSVIVYGGVWIEGVVQRNWYHYDDWPKGKYVPYQVRLINGKYVFTPEDTKEFIRRNTREDWIEIHHMNSLNPSYVKAIEDPPPEQYCALCLRKGKIFCNICQARSYCSEECRCKDWEGHKDCCEAAPSKEVVEKNDKNPKYCSRPLDVSDQIPNPRFSVGTSVIVVVDELFWSEGVVQSQWCIAPDDDSFEGKKYAPYEVRLINGNYYFILEDTKEFIRRNTREDWIEIHHINSLKPSYVKAIEEPPPEQYCARCLRKGKIFCNVCQARSYCSEKCRRKDWEGHKDCCEAPPSKEKVERADTFSSKIPKHCSRPIDLSDQIPNPRFSVGTSVICRSTFCWIEGVVQFVWYEDDSTQGDPYPYVVRHINGIYEAYPKDSNDVIRLNTRDNWIEVHHANSLKPSYVKSIEDPPPERYCTRCLEKGKLLCSTCQARPYCSLDCQGRDWKRHKHCCEEAPSKEDSKKEDLFYSGRPKYTSRPVDALPGVPASRPRIPVGTSVICKAGSTEWIEGVVQCHWYCSPDWAKGVYVPYQIRLTNGKYIFSQHDHKGVIRVDSRDNWIKVHHRFGSMMEAQQEAKGAQQEAKEAQLDFKINNLKAQIQKLELENETLLKQQQQRRRPPPPQEQEQQQQQPLAMSSQMEDLTAKLDEIATEVESLPDKSF